MAFNGIRKIGIKYGMENRIEGGDSGCIVGLAFDGLDRRWHSGHSGI